MSSTTTHAASSAEDDVPNGGGRQQDNLPPPPSSSSYPPPPSMMMLHALQASLGSDLLHKIQHQSKILVVGAGGIGCELLKNLSLCGFAQLTVIDLDTIDVSNLNRQLLFRSSHVGKPKCAVACQVATTHLLGEDEPNDDANNHTNVEYKAIHGNVCDNDIFNVNFVSQFDVVLSALDNVTARRRVNRLCLAANNGVGVPLIEAGTTGYLGQVSVITRTVQCYECRPQEPPKVYPICTIRSTPSAPVHTIVWAKECYKLLFHPKVEESMLYEAVNDDDESGNETTKENGGDDDNGGGGYEPSVYMDAVLEYRKTLAEGDANDVNDIAARANRVLQALYCDEIHKQLSMDRYKTARKTPVAMRADDCSPKVTTHETVAPTSQLGWSATQIWTQQQCASQFVHCLVQAYQRTKTKNKTDDGSSTSGVLLPEFDKDDDLAMQFVTAASNLRNYVFGIDPIQSYYSAKGIAGNIIPAIATTNAIVAGLQILQAFHVLRGQLDGKNAMDAELVHKCRYINCVRQPSRNGLILIASSLEPPNPNCYVCRSATVHVQLTLSNWTLQDLLDKVLKTHLGFVEPALFLEGNGIWEEDEDALVPNLSKKLVDLPCGGIKNGSVVMVEDYSQDMSVEVVVTNCDTWPTEGDDEGNEDSGESEPDPFKFVVGGSKPTAAVPAAAVAASDAHTNGDDGTNYATSKSDEDNEDDDVVEILDDDAEPASDKKRASSDDGSPPPSKKPKGRDPSDVIEID